MSIYFTHEKKILRRDLNVKILLKSTQFFYLYSHSLNSFIKRRKKMIIRRKIFNDGHMHENVSRLNFNSVLI